MSLSEKTKREIDDLLKTIVKEKLIKYRPETEHMPFHYRLLGKDRYAMFSFIQSMNTTFGISIWEQVAVILAKGAGNYAERQYKLLGEIDRDTENLINQIHYKLRKGEVVANKIPEIRQIREKIKKGGAKVDPDSVVDLFVKIKDEENYFDITSAKPNMKEFVALKLKLLRWTGLRLSQEKNVKVFTSLAIPYNPYHPEPYERWTLKGLYDLENNEILVGKEFWNFIASDNIYEELLDVFQEVGEELREEIDRKFAEFRRK
ncbi:MAG: TdeIII family type II restriction endonuclease [Candidatus Aerophobetes bacterium]|nr:TdeIII family type II restriction endonuclease [Candidatus Aerophobetes bacterium]